MVFNISSFFPSILYNFRKFKYNVIEIQSFLLSSALNPLLRNWLNWDYLNFTCSDTPDLHPESSPVRC